MSDWRDVFEPPQQTAGSRDFFFRLVRRHGHDLLVIPREHRSAARAMALYPAQTWPARLGKALLRFALGTGLPVPLPKVNLVLSDREPLIEWLRVLTEQDAAEDFAILPGNPHARGRRHIILSFRALAPTAVLKIGVSDEARALIGREAAFLKTHSSTRPHLPLFLGTRQTPRWHGLALRYIEGDPPPANATAGMCEDSNPGSILPEPFRSNLSSVRRLSLIPSAANILQHFTGSVVTPALFHGDFAPWNVRQARAGGKWTVLDWERGESEGVPGWDWFHWLIHVSVLVQRHDTQQSVRFLADGLRNPDFLAYAHSAKIAGLEKVLLAGYLVYLHEFIVPPEIKAIIARLRDAIASWL